jgi:DNA-binding HxlR family transcriptional regulator
LLRFSKCYALTSVVLECKDCQLAIVRASAGATVGSKRLRRVRSRISARRITIWSGTERRVIVQGDNTITMDICPIAEAARLLGDKWTLIILRDLMQGPCRFKDLERSGEGISPSVLTARLHELELHGIVSRMAYREIPPRVEYTLTEKGHDAVTVVEALRCYGEKWLLPSHVQPV